jgi:hypothetical protein
MDEQWLRANMGLAPDGTWPTTKSGNIRTTDSSRFLTHQDQLKVYLTAESRYSQSVNGKLIIDMERTIGEGYVKESNRIFTTHLVEVRYDNNGNIISLFPLKPY